MRARVRPIPLSELYFDDEASAALDCLEADRTRRQLLTRVNVVLDQLETDPGDRSVRPLRFTNGLWCVTIFAGDDEWSVLWEPHPDDPESVIVQYLGPSSFG